MNNHDHLEDIRLLQIKLADIKAQIMEAESRIQTLWLDLLDVRAKLAAAKQIDDENGENAE